MLPLPDSVEWFQPKLGVGVNVSIRYNGWGEACPIENTWVDLGNATFNDTSTWYDGNGEYRIVASVKSGEKKVVSKPVKITM